MKTDYKTLLKDPRWQKKRLEILNRDDFTCQACGDKETTLHVHHCCYSAGKAPWEYEDSSLVTLCETCHADETEWAAEKKLFLETVAMKGLLFEHFNALSASLHRLPPTKYKRDAVIYALGWALESPGFLDYLVDCHRGKVKPQEVKSNG